MRFVAGAISTATWKRLGDSEEGFGNDLTSFIISSHLSEVAVSFGGKVDGLMTVAKRLVGIAGGGEQVSLADEAHFLLQTPEGANAMFLECTGLLVYVSLTNGEGSMMGGRGQLVDCHWEVRERRMHPSLLILVFLTFSLA